MVCDRWDKPNPEESGTWKRLEPFYGNELGSYLRKHHGLAYVNLYPYFLSAVEVKPPGIHFMSGKTVRTAVSKENHVVIAKYGELLWETESVHKALGHLTGLMKQVRQWRIDHGMEP